MFDDSHIIAGLEIGTTKVCVVVGEQAADGGLNIIGIGQSSSHGVRKGEIIDPQKAEEDLRAAMAEAEQMADVEIRSVYLGVTGGHIRGFTNRGVHPVVSADREITEDDVEDVIKNAKAINLPAENHVIHAVRQHFSVDGQEHVDNPVGMLGARLEVDMHVIHGIYNRLQNAIRVVRATALDVEGIAFNGIASSLAVLDPEQKELGALVVDIGGGTTEYVVHVNGVIRHAGVLAVGGDHVTNDLAYGLKVPLSRAEKLKLEHGSALVNPAVSADPISITSEAVVERKPLNVGNLQRIMSARMEEILRLVAQDMESSGCMNYLRAGVLFCGGASQTPGLIPLAENIFQMNAGIAHASAISGLANTLDRPEFATAIGLVKFGSMSTRRRTNQSQLLFGLKGVMSKFKSVYRFPL